jgi:outer membrane protein assembly factor BamA
MKSVEGPRMRFKILGFLLCSGLLLAQAPGNNLGPITVREVEVEAGSSVSSEHLQAITKAIENQTYLPSPHEEIVERARFTLQRYGYFKADVSLSDMRPVNPDQTAIAVTLAIREGQLFRLKQIAFAGNQAILESGLRNQFAIANGELFDVEKIRVGLEGIRRLYVSHGYINFAPVPNTDANDETRLVTLNIDCDEGKQFRFGKLEVLGQELHPGDRDRFLIAWKPFEGGVYNGEEVEQFWKDMAPLLPPNWRLEQHLRIRQDLRTPTATLNVLLPGSN